MAKKYDDFDEPEGDGVFDQVLTIVGEHKRTFAIASVSAAAILLGLVVWGMYPDANGNGSNQSVPIVRADAGDYKTTPDNPGGMEIPYRDSTVFSSSAPEGSTENILAEDTSEQPVPRSQLFAGLNTEGQPVISEGAQDLTAGSAPSVADQPKGEVEEIEAAINMGKPAAVEPPSNDALVKEAIGTADAPSSSGLNPVLSEAAPKAVEQKVASATTTPAALKSATKAATDKAAEKVAKTEPAAGALTAIKAITPGGYYVQVGSVRSESGAGGEWKKIQAKYSSLGGVKYRTQEANLGAKGVFYRIQAGPMSKDSATSVCNSIKAKTPGGCLVTK